MVYVRYLSSQHVDISGQSLHIRIITTMGIIYIELPLMTPASQYCCEVLKNVFNTF